MEQSKSKSVMTARGTSKDDSNVTKKANRDTDRSKLLNSLNDMTDQIAKPSIAEDKDKQHPQWLQQTLKEEAVRAGVPVANLGKPTSRQDAVHLGKWFKNIIDTIEQEFQLSRTQAQNSGVKRIFPSQKTHEGELQQTDTYLLI